MYTHIPADTQQYFHDIIAAVGQLIGLGGIVAFAAVVPLIGSYLIGG